MICEKPRIAHAHFYQGEAVDKSSPYDRVVSVVWTLKEEEIENDGRKENGFVLTFGGTIFNKDSKTDFWHKKPHRERAIERFNTCPIRIQILHIENMSSDVAMDWYIANHLIYKYGTHNKKEPFLHTLFISTNLDTYYPWEIKKSVRVVTDDMDAQYSPYWLLFPFAVGFIFTFRNYLPSLFQEDPLFMR